MKNMKKYRKYLASVLAILLTAGLTGTFAYAKNQTAEQSSAVSTEAMEDTAEALANRSVSEMTAGKDETVYVIANADGTVEKIIVSDWLQNAAGSDSLNDVSDLKDITNVKSDASYQMNDDGAIVWDTKGEDLYYQGVSENELPVDMKVTYLLDGKPISAEELAGKSGRVTIRYTYENKQYQTVTINGKQEKIYVPFGMLTGMIFDNDRFSNIEVSNGKIISDGNRTIVAGFALPGLQENLALDPEKFQLPETVEINADVKDFSLGMTVSIAANGLFNDIDTENLSSLNDLTDGLSQMTDAMKQLLDGSSALYDGLATLLDKSQELSNGIHQLAEGAGALKSGADTLANGAGALKTGADSLAAGAGTLKDGTGSLADGAGKLSAGTAQLAAGAGTLNEGASALSAGTGSLKDGTAQLNGGSAQLCDGARQLSEGLNTLTQNNDALNNGAKQVFDTLLETANMQIAAAGLQAPELTVDNYAETLTAVIASLDKDAVYQKALEQVTAGVEAKRAYITEQVTAAVEAQVREQVSTAVIAQVEDTVRQQVLANEAAIRETVIQQAAGMSSEQYAQAVQTGLIPQEQQQAIEAAIQNTVNQTVDDQIKSDAVQQQISALTEQNTKAQMQSDAVRQTIAQNTEAQIQKAIADTMAGDEVQQKLSAASEGAKSLISLKTQLDSYNTFYVGLQQYTAGVASAADGAESLKSGAESLQAGAAQVDNGAAQLNAGASQLENGTKELKDGADSLSKGANELKNGTDQIDSGAGSLQAGAAQISGGAASLSSGAKQLADGMSSLYDGILKLDNGGTALVEGVAKLKDGAMQLSDGLKKFDEEGLQALTAAIDGDLTETLERFKATVEASRTYRSFSGIDDSMNGEVKFIYKTAEIRAKKEE
ncbi:MAG: hypothetical protein IKI58_09635 [Oscillospiraceae bacterium]|nr:hypothetical protein [Oscillospiraceae bacterium]